MAGRLMDNDVRQPQYALAAGISCLDLVRWMTHDTERFDTTRNEGTTRLKRHMPGCETVM